MPFCVPLDPWREWLGANRMKVCFFIWGLRAAGAERVLSFLANAWSDKGWQVVILTMEDAEAEPFYPLAEAIEVRPLDLLGSSHSFVSALTQNQIGRAHV